MVSIYCLYNASSQAQTQWLYNGAILTKMSEQRTFDKYRVYFTGDITSAVSGIYTLEVTDGIAKITMNIRVTVLGYPTLVDPQCMPVIRHVWEHDNTVFNCTYKDAPKELVIVIINPSVIYCK